MTVSNIIRVARAKIAAQLQLRQSSFQTNWNLMTPQHAHDRTLYSSQAINSAYQLITAEYAARAKLVLDAYQDAYTHAQQHMPVHPVDVDIHDALYDQSGDIVANYEHLQAILAAMDYFPDLEKCRRDVESQFLTELNILHLQPKTWRQFLKHPVVRVMGAALGIVLTC